MTRVAACRELLPALRGFPGDTHTRTGSGTRTAMRTGDRTMSRTTTSRLATAGMLTLATGLAGLVLAPSASAATTLDPVKLSATTVQPGQDFTISGTDCVSPADADYDGVAVVMSQDGDIYEEAEPAADGSWSITTAFPKDMAAGGPPEVAFCDWYTD